MKKTILYTVCLAVLTMTGCDKTVLEFPENGGIDPTLVNVNLTLAIDPKIESYEPSERSKVSEADLHDVRWIVEVFRDEIGGDLVEQRVLSCEQAVDGHHTIRTSLTLHAARYQIVAWMDYVDNGSTADKYYNVNSLSSISVPEAGNYIGDEDHKDTYIDKFLDKLAARRTKAGSIAENLLTRKPDLSTIRVQVEYAGYFPSGFNAYTNKPNDARTGMSFGCSMQPLSDKEAHLAGDYIFVNGSESAVTVNLTLRDGEGNLLNRIEGINVPIVRGKLTVIRDEFLTRSYAPGIGIDPGFDGEINVVIPD